MAIKLLGTDVPNTTAQPQPEVSAPVMPEDSSKLAQQVISQGMARTDETLQRTNASLAASMAEIPKTTQRALGVSYEYDQRELQSRERSAQINQNSFTNLADTVIKFLDADQRRQEREAKAKAEALKTKQEDAFFRTSAAVDDYLAKLQTELRTNPGGLAEAERQFKSMVNDNPDISSEHRAKLYGQFYGAVSSINAEYGRNLVDVREKYQAQYRASRTEDVLRASANVLTNLAYADNPETVAENLKAIDDTLSQIYEDKALTDFDKIVIATRLQEAGNKALGQSLTTQAEFRQKTGNFTAFIQAANKVKAAGLSAQDEQAQIGLLAHQYNMPDSITRVFGRNFNLQEAVDTLELQNRQEKAIQEGSIAAQDAVPFPDLLIGNLVAQSRGDENSQILTALVPGSRNHKRVMGVIKDYNEYLKLRQEVSQQNLVLQGDALSNNEAFAKALLSRLGGNQTVSPELLSSWGISLKAETLAMLQKPQRSPEEEANLLNELRNIYTQRNEVIRARQASNMERLNAATARMRSYGLDQGFDKFPKDRYDAEMKVYKQRMTDAQNRINEEARRLNPGGIPNGSSSLFKIPHLAKVQAGGKESFAPFKPGTQFTYTGSYLEQRKTHKHAGVDFAAAEGTPIVAHIPMQVVDIKYDDDGYGHYITMKGQDGFYYRYTHLPARPNLRKGQVVNAGAEFAKVGNSGRSSGAHLHFEVLSKNTYGTDHTIDPLEHMKRYSPTASPSLPRGAGMNSFINQSGSPTVSTARASIPKEALPLAGGMFIYKGNVYTKDTWNLVQNTRYSPAMPVRQVNNSSKKSDYRNSSLDANHGYKELADDVEFRQALNGTARRLGIPAQWLADLMAFETGGTFSPRADNYQGYRGLIQFSEDSARALGTTQDALIGMTRAQQMVYVEKYIRQRTNNGKWINSPHDLLAAIWYGNSSPESMRKLWANPNISDGQITWGEYSKRLGEHAGRQYDSSLSRRQRLQSRIKNNTTALMASGSTNFYQES